VNISIPGRLRTAIWTVRPRRKNAKRGRSLPSGSGDLFLISLKAGGFGLNLTAADYVIHMDPWWNPAVEAQASDRAHRIGQERPVTVYRLVITIEENRPAASEQGDLASSLLDGSDISSKISADELLQLLRRADEVGRTNGPRKTQRRKDIRKDFDLGSCTLATLRLYRAGFISVAGEGLRHQRITGSGRRIRARRRLPGHRSTA
jgi:hypothetical protein